MLTIDLLDGDVFPEALVEAGAASFLGVADVLCRLEHLGLLSSARYAFVEDCSVGDWCLGWWSGADDGGDVGGGHGGRVNGSLEDALAIGRSGRKAHRYPRRCLHCGGCCCRYC